MKNTSIDHLYTKDNTYTINIAEMIKKLEQKQHTPSTNNDKSQGQENSQPNKRIMKQKNKEEKKQPTTNPLENISQHNDIDNDLLEMEKLCFTAINPDLTSQNIIITGEYIYITKSMFKKHIKKIIENSGLFKNMYATQENTQGYKPEEQNAYGVFPDADKNKKIFKIKNILNFDNNTYFPPTTASSMKVINNTMSLFNNFLRSFLEKTSIVKLDLKHIALINRYIEFIKEKNFYTKWLESLDANNKEMTQIRNNANNHTNRLKEITKSLDKNNLVLQKIKNILKYIDPKLSITKTTDTSQNQAKIFLEILFMHQILVAKKIFCTNFSINDNVLKYQLYTSTKESESNSENKILNFRSQQNLSAAQNKNNYNFTIYIRIKTTPDGCGHNKIKIENIAKDIENFQNLCALLLYEKISESARFLSKHLKTDFDIKILEDILQTVDIPQNQDGAKKIASNIAKDINKTHSQLSENQDSICILHLLFLWTTRYKLEKLKSEGEIYDLLVKKIINSNYRTTIEKFLNINTNKINLQPIQEHCSQNEISAIEHLIKLLFNNNNDIKEITSDNNQHTINLTTKNTLIAGDNVVFKISDYSHNGCQEETSQEADGHYKYSNPPSRHPKLWIIDANKFKTFIIENSTLLNNLIHKNIRQSSVEELINILQLLKKIRIDSDFLFKKLNEENKLCSALEEKNSIISNSNQEKLTLIEEFYKIYTIFNNQKIINDTPDSNLHELPNIPLEILDYNKDVTGKV